MYHLSRYSNVTLIFMEEFYKLPKKRIEGLNYKFQEKFSIKQSYMMMQYWFSEMVGTILEGDEMWCDVGVSVVELYVDLQPTQPAVTPTAHVPKKCRCGAEKIQCGTRAASLLLLSITIAG